MGGKEGLRGYLVQTIACILDALNDDLDWVSVCVEPDDCGLKTDIAWQYNDKARLVQVKSTKGSFSKADVTRWSRELDQELADGDEGELVLIGQATAGAIKVKQVGRVTISPPKNLNIVELLDASSQRLDRFLFANGHSVESPQVREMIVNALVTDLSRIATRGEQVDRSIFESKILDMVRASGGSGLGVAGSAEEKLGVLIERYRRRCAPLYSSWDLGTIGQVQLGVKSGQTCSLDAMYVPIQIGRNSWEHHELGSDQLLAWGPSSDTLWGTRGEHLAVSGVAGSGKTTWINWMFRRLLRHPGAVPIPIELRRLAKLWHSSQLRGAERTIESYASNWFAEHGVDLSTEQLGELLNCSNENRRVVVLIDGWDELGGLGVEMRGKLVGFLDDHKQVLAVVTSRPYGTTRPSHSDNFGTVEIQELRDENIEELAIGFFRHYARQTQEEATQRAKSFMVQLQDNRQAVSLARTALLLTMMLIRISALGPLASQRHELYLACLENLLSALPEYKEEEGALLLAEQYRPDDFNVTFRAAAQLAYGIAMNSTGKPDPIQRFDRSAVFTAQEMIDFLPKSWRRSKKIQFINWLAGASGVLADRTDGTYSFAHRSFQEYLSAWHLVYAEHNDETIESAVLELAQDEDTWEIALLWAPLQSEVSANRLEAVARALLDRPFDGVWLLGVILAEGSGANELARQWAERARDIIKHYWSSGVERCAREWASSDDKDRLLAVQSALLALPSRAKPGALENYRLASLENFLAKATVGGSIDEMRRNSDWNPRHITIPKWHDDERCTPIARGRFFAGVYPQGPFEPVAELLLWPTPRRVAGHRLQVLVELGASKDQFRCVAGNVLKWEPWGQADDEFVAACSRALTEASGWPSTGTWRDLSRYFARTWPRYLRSPVACDLAILAATEWFEKRDNSGAGTPWEDVLRGIATFRITSAGGHFSDLSSPGVRSVAQTWGRSLGLTNPNDDCLALQFGLMEIMSVGWAYCLDDVARRVSCEAMKKACAVIGAETSEQTKSEDLSGSGADGPITDALSRHLTGESSSKDRRTLEEAAQYPENADQHLQSHLRILVRGDIETRDDVLTLDEICDELGMPHLPLLEASPWQ